MFEGLLIINYLKERKIIGYVKVEVFVIGKVYLFSNWMWLINFWGVFGLKGGF